MRNGIIVPCYNEALRLPFREFAEFLEKRKDYVICFVNDGSQDDTLLKLQAFRAGRKKNVEVYNMPVNGGKAEAVRQGTNYLNERYRLNSIGFMDADLSTGFAEYTHLVDQLQESRGELAMTFGSRASKNGGIKRTPFRKLMASIVRIMVMAIHRLPVKDTQCGAKVFLPEVAAECFGERFVSRWLFDVELFIRLTRAFGRQSVMGKLKEIPLEKWVHVEGSRITLRDSLKIPAQLLKIAGNYYMLPQQTRFRPATAAALVLAIQVLQLVARIGIVDPAEWYF